MVLFTDESGAKLQLIVYKNFIHVSLHSLHVAFETHIWKQMAFRDEL